MTQAPATPELVERLRDQRHVMQGDGLAALLATTSEAADALEAQQARIAELEGLLDLHAAMQSEVERAQAAEGASQALADRYEKALSGLIEYFEDGGAHDEGAYDESCPDCQTLQLARQALSSQGRHEGGAFDLLNLAEVATKAVYTHGFGFREVVGPSKRDGKVYVNFAWDDDRLVRAIFFVSPDEAPSPNHTNPEAEHG